jgi:hypothetical protein
MNESAKRILESKRNNGLTDSQILKEIEYWEKVVVEDRDLEILYHMRYMFDEIEAERVSKLFYINN